MDLMRIIIVPVVYFGPGIFAYILRNTKYKYYITFLLGIVLIFQVIQLFISDFDTDMVIRAGFMIPLILVQMFITWLIVRKKK